MKPGNNGICKVIHRIRFCRTFPDNENPPSDLSQQFRLGEISLVVAPKLCCPEPCPRARDAKILAALMRMPETAVDEDHRVEFRQHDIRAAGQTSNMKPVSQPLSVQTSPDQHFGLCVLAADPGHHLGSRHRGSAFSHAAFSSGAVPPCCGSKGPWPLRWKLQPAPQRHFRTVDRPGCRTPRFSKAGSSLVRRSP